MLTKKKSIILHLYNEYIKIYISITVTLCYYLQSKSMYCPIQSDWYILNLCLNFTSKAELNLLRLPNHRKIDHLCWYRNSYKLFLGTSPRTYTYLYNKFPCNKIFRPNNYSIILPSNKLFNGFWIQYENTKAKLFLQETIGSIMVENICIVWPLT